MGDRTMIRQLILLGISAIWMMHGVFLDSDATLAAGIMLLGMVQVVGAIEDLSEVKRQ